VACFVGIVVVTVVTAKGTIARTAVGGRGIICGHTYEDDSIAKAELSDDFYETKEE
jgi:hypothetical protein